MAFTLRSLKDEEVVKVVITTFSGDSKEFVCAGKVLNTGGPDPFADYISKEQGIGYLLVQEIRVETFEGTGGAYARDHNTDNFHPVSW